MQRKVNSKDELLILRSWLTEWPRFSANFKRQISATQGRDKCMILGS